jgi:hypothetical protein
MLCLEGRLQSELLVRHSFRLEGLRFVNVTDAGLDSLHAVTRFLADWHVVMVTAGAFRISVVIAVLRSSLCTWFMGSPWVCWVACAARTSPAGPQVHRALGLSVKPDVDFCQI